MAGPLLPGPDHPVLLHWSGRWRCAGSLAPESQPSVRCQSAWFRPGSTAGVAGVGDGGWVGHCVRRGAAGRPGVRCFGLGSERPRAAALGETVIPAALRCLCSIVPSSPWGGRHPSHAVSRSESGPPVSRQPHRLPGVERLLAGGHRRQQGYSLGSRLEHGRSRRPTAPEGIDGGRPEPVTHNPRSTLGGRLR